MTDPIVTVLIPVYNGEKYLTDAIDSILQQRFKDFELLIIDDGSTDKSAAIAESYRDERVHVLKNNENRGISFTRNLAIEVAKGDFLALLDADDVALPGRLGNQVSYLMSHPEVALCGTQALFIDASGRVTGKYYPVPVDSEEIKVRLAFCNVLINSTIMYRLSALRKTKGYYPGLCEDYEMAVQLNQRYMPANLSGVWVKYRQHENNLTTSFPEKMRQGEKYVIRYIHKQLGIPEDEELISIHHSLIMGYSLPHAHTIGEYAKLFSILKKANQQTKIYPYPAFDKLLFSMWYDKIRVLGGRRALLLFFSRPLFSWNLITFKMWRKVFKQTCWF